MTTTTVVKKNQSSALSTIDYGIDENYTGLQVQQKDIVLPRIQMLQKGVDWEELNELAWKPGDFYHTGLNELIKGSFEAIVVDMKVTTAMHGPKDPNGRREIIKFSSDGIHWDDDGSRILDSERKATDKDDYLNGVAVDSYHYVIIAKGTDFPVLITFKGASYRNAKTLNFSLSRMRPTWKCWTKFYAEDGESNGNKYKKLVAKVQPKKLLEDQDLATLALETWQASNSNRVVLSDEDDPTYD